MKNKSKKVKRHVGRTLMRALGWAIVAVGALTLVFVACAALGVTFPPAVEDFLIVSKVKSSVALSFVAAVAFALIGVVILLSVRVIVKDEKESEIEERAALDARDQAVKEVNASIGGVFLDDESEGGFEGDFMPPTCLLGGTIAGEETRNETAKTDETSSDSREAESLKTVVSEKPSHKTRKHKRRPSRR